MSVHMELSRILIRETDDTHIVELREADADEDEARVFPIVIGLTEAAAIERRLMGQQPPRPQTHELLANIIEGLDHSIDRVEISELRHDELGRGTFYARLFLKSDSGGSEVEIDSRPSDALALGVANDVPIYVAEQVLEEVGRSNEQ